MTGQRWNRSEALSSMWHSKPDNTAVPDHRAFPGSGLRFRDGYHLALGRHGGRSAILLKGAGHSFWCLHRASKYFLHASSRCRHRRPVGGRPAGSGWGHPPPCWLGPGHRPQVEGRTSPASGLWGRRWSTAICSGSRGRVKKSFHHRLRYNGFLVDLHFTKKWKFNCMSHPAMLLLLK